MQKDRTIDDTNGTMVNFEQHFNYIQHHRFHTMKQTLDIKAVNKLNTNQIQKEEKNLEN